MTFYEVVLHELARKHIRKNDILSKKRLKGAVLSVSV